MVLNTKIMRENTKKWYLVQATKQLLTQYSGMRLTLRQIYYRLVGFGMIPNTKYEYQYLSGALVHGRQARILDPEYFVDLTRSSKVQEDVLYTKESWWEQWVREMRDNAYNYLIDKWVGQKYKVFIILEKQALENVFLQVCDQLGITLIVNRGYNSYSQIYEVTKQIKENTEKEYPKNKKFIFFTFGDHDPSGHDIIRNFKKQIKDESVIQEIEINSKFEFIAVTPEQIKEYKLPPEPVKKGDARAKKFIAKFGDAVVELDAIQPDKLQQMILDNVLSYFDKEYYDDVIKPVQDEHREYFKIQYEKSNVGEVLNEEN